MSYISYLTLPFSNTRDINDDIDERMKNNYQRVRSGFVMKMYEIVDWEITVAKRVKQTAIRPSLSFGGG